MKTIESTVAINKKQAEFYNTKKKNWIIAIAVAIIYLTVSILFDLWAFSWIIWVAYAIYRFIVR